jgi:CTP:molybdopterin cytidylyltransferase MocA
VRIGGPKALLVWSAADGSELPLAIAHARCRDDCEMSLIVTRGDIAAALTPHVASFPGTALSRCSLVVSMAPDELGPAGSLAAAVSHIDRQDAAWGGADALLVTPVDHLPADPGIVAALRDTLEQHGEHAMAVRPTHAGRRGHPVLVRMAALDAYRRGEPPPLRDVLCGLGARVVECPVDDDQITHDLNTPEDYARHVADASQPRFFPIK